MKLFARLFIWLCVAVAGAPALAQDRFFDADGVNIRYVDQGKGDAIVLLHGGTSSLESWVTQGVLQNLAQDFRVIAFDARGHGKSGKPHDAAAYGRQQALDVARLLDHLKISRAHIVGYSLGGSTVAQLLTLHPERFLTATQVAAAGRSPEAANDPRIEIEATEIEKECISRSRIYRQAPPNAKPTEADYKTRADACIANKNFDQHSTAASLRGYKDQAVTPDQMKAVKVPTLGVVGTFDHALKEMQELKRLRPNLTLVLVEGASHTGATGILTRPELTVAIREFIATQRAPASKPASY